MINDAYSFGNVRERCARLYTTSINARDTIAGYSWPAKDRARLTDIIAMARSELELICNLAFHTGESARSGDWPEVKRRLGRISDKAKATGNDWELFDWPPVWRRTFGRGVSRYAKQIRQLKLALDEIQYTAFNTALILDKTIERAEASDGE